VNESVCVCVSLCDVSRYRTSVEEVPLSEYVIPLGEAQLLREGSDITLIGWGSQVRVGLGASSVVHTVLEGTL
jgi:pyruvate/2-oxoglutarate/acetoin dehydrogenase E1 component